MHLFTAGSSPTDARWAAPIRVLALAALASLVIALAPAAAHGSKSLVAQRVTGAIALDGVLDESAWTVAPAATEFWQRKPNEGSTAAFPSEFRVVYTDRAVYVGVVAFDPDPDAIRKVLTRRDEPSPADWLEVGIDAYRDRRTAFVFAVNAAGVQRDHVIYDDTTTDYTWDGVWSAATRVDERGWTAEFRIPMHQLRFVRDAGAWGIQVRRVVGRTQEESVWAPSPVAKPQLVSFYGTLTGLANITPSRQLELLPYAAGGVAYDTAATDDATDALGGAGLDVKYGLSSNVTLSGTLNPDFGQVEADPSVVNLTDKETFLLEKRPFFVEGADQFRLSLATADGSLAVEELFHSRRIGATPHRSLAASDEFVTEADVATIYGAAKFAGKTSSGWSVGLLEAVTAEEHAVLADADGNQRREVIEPLTNYAVVNVQREANRGRTRFGATATSVARRLGGTGVDNLHSQSIAGGLQFNHRFGDDRWSVEARALGSFNRGSAAAIDETQRASQRYYQRPDAGYLDYDPTRTSLSGAGLLWSVTHDLDKRLRWSVVGDVRTPGLELNDLGFQLAADRVSQQAWLEWRDDAPGELLIRYNVKAQTWLLADFEPRFRQWGAFVSGDLTLTEYWGVNGGFGSTRHIWDPAHLRGGPLIRRDPDWWGWFGVSTDYRSKLQAFVNGNFSWVDASGTRTFGISPGVSARPRSNIELSAAVDVSLGVIDDQFIADPMTAGGAPAFVLGRVDQTALGLTLRANYTISPKLSLQLYAQPFTAVGAFDRYREVVDPRADGYEDRFRFFDAGQLTDMDGQIDVDSDGDGVVDYAFGRPDFNFRQLRSNLVMRWEYSPGSTLFAVWTYRATGFDDSGAYAFGDELSGIASAPAETAFLLKLNYRLGL